MLDIETEDSKDKGETTSEKNFVYDLYYTNTDSFGDYLDDEKAEKYLRLEKYCLCCSSYRTKLSSFALSRS